MKVNHRWLCLLSLAALLSLAGCGKKDATADQGGPTPISDEEIAAIRSSLTQGMQFTALSKVRSSDEGKTCVVMVQMPKGGLQMIPPPPPPGMVQTLGSVAFYRGQLDSVSADSLTVRGAYPTPGNYKRLEIAKGDIRSVYLGR
jgi:hypothetical protein